MLSLPSVCNGCRAQFGIEHSLDCHFGGLVSCRHNEVCDAFVDLASLVWSLVTKEPIVCDSVDGADTLIADLNVHGVWEPQTEALFEWLTLMPSLIVPALLRMFCTLLRVRGSTNTCRLVKIAMPHLLLFVFL